MKEAIEIKVKRTGERWEDQVPVAILDIYIGTRNSELVKTIAYRAAEAVANDYQAEARWNYEWSLQGHYVAPVKTLKDYIGEE